MALSATSLTINNLYSQIFRQYDPARIITSNDVKDRILPDLERLVSNISSAESPTGVAVGTYGNATNVGQFTVNQFGELTFAANVPISISTLGTALTKVDDTNVTLTLGGSPATALVSPASLTLGWMGTLGVSRGGTNIASYAVGDILYASAIATLSKLAIGSAGNVLSVAAGLPSWVSSASIAGTWAYVATAINYAALTTDTVINCTAAGITITLPTAVGVAGKIYVVKKSVAGAAVVANTTAAQTIDGALTQNITGLSAIMVLSTGANWIII